MNRISASLCVIAFFGTAHAQGICLRPSTTPVAQCVGGARSVAELGLCASMIEIFNKDVDEWLKCRLEAIDREAADKRSAAVDSANGLRDAVPSSIRLRGALR